MGKLGRRGRAGSWQAFWAEPSPKSLWQQHTKILPQDGMGRAGAPDRDWVRHENWPLSKKCTAC